MSTEKKKRQYTKKSPYWEMKKNPQQAENEAVARQFVQKATIPNIEYETYGENLMAFGSREGGSAIRNRGQNGLSDYGKYENIKEGLLPYEVSNGKISVNQAIELTQRAYANVATFRNAIEVMVEFSNSDIHLKGGNASSRAFVKSLLEKINIYQLKDEFFREYYRSGNVFMYRFDGKFRSDDYEKMKQAVGAKSNTVPVRYVVLNPTNIFVENGIVSGGFSYIKMLSTYEIERLKNPQTEEEKDMFNALPDWAKKEIKNYSSGSARYIYIPIDPKRLYYVFYKKQPYEPLAVPMGFPVLNDIEWKLQLKRMDMALSRTIEHAILLITTGAEPDKGGINPENVKTLQNLFKNSTIGRVLVADYTTKGEWLIPDFKELLGPEKYEVVDRDIKDGLQTLLVGEDKFANAVIKAKVFIERLKEGQKAFLNNFLVPEIERVCAEMNFKKIPTLEFEEIMLQDEVTLQKLFVRMAELGMLTPDQLNDAIKTGILPDKEKLLEGQKEYKSERDKGYFTPLIGGAKKEEGRPGGSKAPQTTKKVSPIGTASEMYSTKKLLETIEAFEGLRANVENSLKNKFEKDTLDENQKEVAVTLAKSIFANESQERWGEAINEYIVEPKIINQATANEADEIALRYEVDALSSLLLTKCKTN